MLYLLWNNQSNATTLWFFNCESVTNRPTVVNKTVARPHAAVILQFAVIFMRRQCQSICQRQTCVIGAGLLERAWQALQSKVKPWTIFLLHAWKSITQTPVVNARETDPTQRWAFPPPLPLTPLHPPFLHITPETPNSAVCVQCWVKQPPYIPPAFSFLSLLIYRSLQKAAEHQWRILGNSCKMIHHLADLYHMHAFLQVHM